MQDYQIILWTVFVVLTASKALLKNLNASKAQMHRLDFNQ